MERQLRLSENHSFITKFFPLLEELDLSYPQVIGLYHSSLALPQLRKVNFSGHFFLTDEALFNPCKNCERLEEVMFNSDIIYCIASAIRERPSLRSLSVNRSWENSSEFIMSLKGLTCLELSFRFISDELLISIAKEALPLRKLLLQGCRNYTYAGIFWLVFKCRFVRHLDLENAEFLNDGCVAELSSYLSDLVFINVSGCTLLTDSALLALIRNCPLLNEMKGTSIGSKRVAEDFNSSKDFVVNHQVNSLYLGDNSWLSDERIKMIASMCPNLQLLDLSSCCGISDDGIVEVLRGCCKIRHLSLAYCSGVKLLGMNFEVPKLEVLNLSHSGIEDEALLVISKCCRGLLQLDLENCSLVTTKGVKEVVESCTQLREINLGSCVDVSAKVVAWMVNSRPLLKKIKAPPSFRLSDSEWERLWSRGFLVCYS